MIFKNHVYSAEQTDLVLPCSKTYRLDEKFVDTAENQLLKVTLRGEAHAAWLFPTLWLASNPAAQPIALKLAAQEGELELQLYFIFVFVCSPQIKKMMIFHWRLLFHPLRRLRRE